MFGRIEEESSSYWILIDTIYFISMSVLMVKLIRKTNWISCEGLVVVVDSNKENTREI